jgi:pseudouridine-5'-phosphate glycosidase
MNELPKFFEVLPEIKRALDQGQPIVALESAVITHGLPYPENHTLAEDMEDEVRAQSAIPATIAVIDGKIRVGLTIPNLLTLAESSGKLRKLSSRDLGAAIVHKPAEARRLRVRWLLPIKWGYVCLPREGSAVCTTISLEVGRGAWTFQPT